LRFDALDGATKRALRDCMLSEQGALCAYTMAPIGRGADIDFHIEHIQPQWLNTDRELAYKNIVLCAPTGDKSDCGWGALKKGGAEVDDVNFVSPLRKSCETRLNFGSAGQVRAADENDNAAERTIELLALNHKSLVDARSSALSAMGLSAKARGPLSAAGAERLAQIVSVPDQEGRIAPYCIAIKQVAERFALQQRKRAQRLVGAKGQ
jgi:uncharacterized protein (TIGR02646 family)